MSQHCNMGAVKIWVTASLAQLFSLTSCHPFGGFPGRASGKEPAYQCRRHKRCRLDPWVRKDPLEEEMATHFSIFAWRIPQTEEPGGLQSTGSQRVAHD